MLEEAILEAKAGGTLDRPRDFSPQITVDAPILIPDDYVPDSDFPMGPNPAPNEAEAKPVFEPSPAELITRSGNSPHTTENLFRLSEFNRNKSGRAHV